MLKYLPFAVAGVLIAVLVGTAPKSPPIDVPDPRPPRASFLDSALSCLVLGNTEPPVDAWTESQLSGVRTALAWILEAQMTGDFGAFLQFHRKDVSWASRNRRADLPRLAALLAGFGVTAADVPDDWGRATRRFWQALNPEPPLVAVRPETAECRLFEAEIPMRDGVPEFRALAPAEWRVDDQIFRYRSDYAPAIPHRRTVDELTTDDRLTWCEVRFAIELRGVPGPSGLHLRFVWDPIDDEWFLHGAATVFSAAASPDAIRSLLLL